MPPKKQVIAAIECPDIFGRKLTKIRVNEGDLLNSDNDESSNNCQTNDEVVDTDKSQEIVFTEYDFRRVILCHINITLQERKEQEQEGEVVRDFDMDVYDPGCNEFVRIGNTKDSMNRFGSRLRCIVSNIIYEETDRKSNTSSTIISEPLAIMGRYFSNDKDGIEYCGKRLLVEEMPNESEGTGLNIWDGSLLLARYLEVLPNKVHSKTVLELGSGCGLVGIASGMLGAKEVHLTDLEYTLPLMKKNVEINKKNYDLNCEKVSCRACDWFNPPSLEALGMKAYPDVILIADCVWVIDLVEPLLTTLEKYLDIRKTEVIISYQQRGKEAHDRFLDMLHSIFDSVLDVDTSELGISKPKNLFLFSCRK